MANKKIEKEFCLTDNTVNVYGYRLLTEGLLLDRFKPSIGYLMHKRENGVAVRWDDFRIEGDKLFAKPIVNETLFPNLSEQIEDGFYDSASVGHIVALELSDEKSLKLPGQVGPTVTKWFPRECSLVDIPGNYNAIAKLYDESNNVLHDLSANNFNTNQNNAMSQIIVTAATLGLMNLHAENTTSEQFEQSLQNLIAKANRVDALETEVQNLQAESSKKEIASIISQGKLERKLTNELAAKLEVDYASNPQGLKALVDSMKSQTLVAGNEGEIPSNLPEKFKDKTFDDLYMSGELEELKVQFPEYYKTLKK